MEQVFLHYLSLNVVRHLLCKYHKALLSIYSDFINVLIEHLILNTQLLYLYTFGIFGSDISVILSNRKKVFKIYYKLVSTILISTITALTEIIFTG